MESARLSSLDFSPPRIARNVAPHAARHIKQGGCGRERAFVETEEFVGADEHLCWKSSMDWPPGAILFDEDVGEDDELPHDRGNGDFGFFASVPEALVVVAELRVEPGRGEGGETEAGSHEGASAPDVALAGLVAAVARQRRKAGEETGGFCRASAQLRQADDESDGRDGTDAGDGEHDIVTALERGIGADAAFDLGVQALDVRGQNLQPPAEFGLEKGGLAGAAPVGQRGLVGFGRRARANSCNASIASGAGASALGSRAWPMTASTRASSRSVLAS